MTRLLVALALGALSGLPQQPSGAPVSRGANLWIDAVVLDREGRPATTLAPDELEVWISGYRIPILESIAVTPETRGRTVVLILDDGAVGPALAARVRETARFFVDLMAAGDRLAILSLHGDAMTLTGDQSQLRRTIDAYRVRGLPFRIEDAGEHVLGTVESVSRQLAEGAHGRIAIVAIGAGWLFDTPLPPPGSRDLRANWVAAMRAAARASATLYVIDPAGLGMTGLHHGGSGGFARETGGHAFLNTNDLRGAAARIWQEAGNYYLLGVADPAIQQSAELRQMEVKVLRQGLSARARRAIPGR